MDHTAFTPDTDGPEFIRRPIIGLAIAFVAGTALGLHDAISCHIALRLGLASFVLGLICQRLATRSSRRQGEEGSFNLLSTACIILCVLALSCGNAGWHKTEKSIVPTPGHIANAVQVEVEGWVTSYPQPLTSGFSDLNSWLLRFRVERVRLPRKKWEALDREFQVYWNERVGSRKPRYGQVWKLKGIEGTSLAPAEEGRRRPASVSVYSRQTRYVSDGRGSKLKDWRYEARARSADHLRIGIEEYSIECNIFQALLLGYRSRLPREIKQMGAATGTMHIFAVSGLHVGLVAGLLIGALSAMRVSRIHWIYILAPLLIAYTLLTGARPSAVRACIMAIVYFMAPAIGRRSDSASALSLAAIMILAWDPNQLRDIGFIYSFVVVIGLISLYPIFWDLTRPLWKDDPMRAKPERWRVCWLTCLKYLAGLLAVSCAAWLTSMPLTAYYFGRFTPIAILGNLVVIPLAFIVVFSGCLSLVLGAVLELFAEIFNHSAFAAIRVFMVSIGGLSRLPMATFEITRPALPLIIGWYIALSSAAFMLWQRKLGKRIDRQRRE